MALQYVGYAASTTTSVALPAFTAGDLALVAAYRDNSNTAPSLPAGWTDIASSGADTNSMRIGYRVLQGGDTTSGVWTNATDVQVLVLRGQHLTTPVGTAVPYGASNSATIAYQSVRIFGDPVRSWVVGFAGHRTASNVNSGVVSGMATRSAGAAGPIYPGGTLYPSDIGPGTSNVACHTQADTFRHQGDYPANTMYPSEVAVDEWWFDGVGFNVDSSAAWRSYVVEVQENTANQTMTTTAEVSLASGGVPVTRTSHRLMIRARKTNAAHTGVMRCQLFEGATPRSAVLSSAVLTTTQTVYSLPIADSDAALIGSYANLSVRFNGYSSEGTPTVFEVDQVWLETPQATVVVGPPVFPQVLLFAIIPAAVGNPPGSDIFPSPTLFPSETSP